MTPKNKSSKSKKDIESEELFDDCPICQAMKAAQVRGHELSYEELQAAFDQANQQQSTKPN